MAGNRGNTSLKCKRRRTNPMREFDQLPADLRAWLRVAVLPWRPGSARRAFDKAFARTGDTALALQELDRLQAQLISRDAAAVWGAEHPATGQRPQSA